nr:uncharacterized protein LOC109177202 isoform X2 [Ipomoea batatas]
MGVFSKSSWLVLHCWVFLVLSLRAQPNAASEVSIRSWLKATVVMFVKIVPQLASWMTTYLRIVMAEWFLMQHCRMDFIPLKLARMGLVALDTVPPTAYLMAPTSFTNATNITVNISFTEPCGFGCSSVNSCNLFVYGSGQVLPSTLRVIQPNLTYSVVVSLPTSSQFGKVTIVTDKSFCTDAAGNKFTRTENSSLVVHYA